MRLQAVTLPELGIAPEESILISHWYARRGDEVWEGDRLVEVLVGAATFDVPAPASGRLARIRVREDERVRPGQVLAHLAVDAAGDPGGDDEPP
jgi:pyruvate/2-oxoglutarate dehydrogenase complex dihydrolipoamide acyltransferase (E2) component